MRVATEPCPACHGTGTRLVPPAPLPRGGTGRQGKGRRHGFVSTYQAGCRCPLCRAAKREYMARHAAARRAAS